VFRHVYLYKLKPDVDPVQVKQKLMTLCALPSVYHMEVGLDFKHAQNSYDLIEDCFFKTQEDFLEFEKDAYHETIRQYMAGVQQAGVKIDYETEADFLKGQDYLAEPRLVKRGCG
jgi:hypothetical protein